MIEFKEIHSILADFLAVNIGKKLPFLCLFIFEFIYLALWQGNVAHCLVMVLYTGVNFWMFFLLVQVIGNLGFYLLQTWPLRPLLTACYSLLGGLAFPLDLLPVGLYHSIRWNPFALIAYHYSRSFQGLIPLEEVLAYAAGLSYGVSFSTCFINGPSVKG